MKFYLNFSTPNSKIFSNCYYKIHNINVNGEYAVFFPQYVQDVKGGTLGRIIRVFASSKESLESLRKQIATKKSRIHSSPIKAVPNDVIGHFNVRRVRTKTQSDIRRMIRRAIERGETKEQALDAIKFANRANMYPRVFLYSNTTKQTYPIHINKIPQIKPVRGKFNRYGLGVDGATVPFFE